MLAVLKSPKVWLLLLIAVAYMFLPQLLPPRFEVEKDWHSGRNWFGQPGWISFVCAAGLLITLCALRFLIVRKSRNPGNAAIWYCLVLAVIIPAIWLFVVIDWDNEAVADIACWVGDPIALLLVPSVLFFVDLTTPLFRDLGSYLLRSIVEICVLVPVWSVVWVYIEAFILGWVGP